MLADEVHSQLIRQFVWTPDKEQFGQAEYWTSLKDGVDAGETVRGDCDDFSITAAEMLVERGAERGSVSVATCLTPSGPHMVCLLDGWMIDNRQRHVIDWRDADYTWLSVMRLDEPGTWRRVTEGA
mgnify:CR=1 FL=1